MIPSDTVSLEDYERHFPARVDAAVFAYINGHAADGVTQRANREQFSRIELMPRALADMSGATASSVLFGEELPYPIIVAPTAYHRLLHPDGEIATATAASLTRTWMTVSTQASVPLEEIAAVSSSPLWFQLYMQPVHRDSLSLVERAEAAGYRAIVVTVDAPLGGIRNVEQRAGFHLPADVTAANLVGMAPSRPLVARRGSPVFDRLAEHAPRWTDIEDLCRRTRLPVLLKGVLNPDDCDRALAAGCSGIIVSNHGGRVLDTVPSTMSALESITARVAGRMPVLVDGGFRRGTDIVKAIALGARAVMIGQPILHALAVGGVPGVAHVLTILQTELETAMALLGRPSLASIDRTVLTGRDYS